MIVFPNAKINIGLFVTERREDGYHNLETIFYPTQVRDALEIINAGDLTMRVSGLTVAGNQENNLVWKAYQLLLRDFPDHLEPLSIHLHKVIPMGAGMGGGSADGAFMLSLLNDYFSLNLSSEQLIQYALDLGSDCPFFIVNKPALAQGRGELLQPIALDLSAYSFHIICPQIHVSTAQAFADIMPAAATFDLNKIATLPIEEWQQYIFNDFEKTVFKVHPALADIKQQLYAGGAIYASMSGTGAALYGIFPKNKKAEISCDIAFSEFYY